MHHQNPITKPHQLTKTIYKKRNIFAEKLKLVFEKMVATLDLEDPPLQIHVAVSAPTKMDLAFATKRITEPNEDSLVG